MIEVSQRVLHAIDLMAQGKYEFALEQAAIAIDISAQRFYKVQPSQRNLYKVFLDEYCWVIELMALNGIDVKNSFFSNFTILKPDGKRIEKPRLSDILYHSVRCNLIHSTGVPLKLRFVSGRIVKLADEYIALPEQVIWGMLASIVFSKCNISEKSEGDYFINYENSHFLIRESWGREDLLQSLYEQHVKIKVKLNIPSLQKN